MRSRFGRPPSAAGLVGAAVVRPLLSHWCCGGMEDVSRVCDLSVGGLFLSTPVPRPVGVSAKLDFLVPEGAIGAEAVVEHLIPSGGSGFEIHGQNRPGLPEPRSTNERDSHFGVRPAGAFFRSPVHSGGQLLLWSPLYLSQLARAASWRSRFIERLWSRTTAA